MMTFQVTTIANSSSAYLYFVHCLPSIDQKKIARKMFNNFNLNWTKEELQATDVEEIPVTDKE